MRGKFSFCWSAEQSKVGVTRKRTAEQRTVNTAALPFSLSKRFLPRRIAICFRKGGGVLYDLLKFCELWDFVGMKVHYRGVEVYAFRGRRWVVCCNEARWAFRFGPYLTSLIYLRICRDLLMEDLNNGVKARVVKCSLISFSFENVGIIVHNSPRCLNFVVKTSEYRWSEKLSAPTRTVSDCRKKYLRSH